MKPAAPSPFVEVPEAEWVCGNGLCFAIFDSYPVSPGHVLVITRRVVPTFFECTAAEQGALMELVGEVKALLDERLDPRPDGYNVGFNAGAAAGTDRPSSSCEKPSRTAVRRASCDWSSRRPSASTSPSVRNRRSAMSRCTNGARSAGISTVIASSLRMLW